MPAVPRPGQATQRSSLIRQLTDQLNQGGQLPEGYHSYTYNHTPAGPQRSSLTPGQQVARPDVSFWEQYGGPIMATGAVLGGSYLPGLFGGGSGTAAGSTAAGVTTPLTELPGATGVIPGLGTAAATSTGAKVGESLFSKLLPFLIGGGLDVLSSAIGGGGQERQSFAGSGITDPKEALGNALKAIYAVGNATADHAKQGVNLSHLTAQTPQPIQVPGLPFQIGGGLATDPALGNPASLMFPGLNLPQNLFPQQGGQAQPRPTGQTPVRRRTDSNGNS